MALGYVTFWTVWPVILSLLSSCFQVATGYPCMIINGSSIFLTIPESFPPGKVFKTLDMIEGDSTAKGNINLRLKEQNPYFGLDSASKGLVLLHAIDREALEAKNPPETRQTLSVVCEYLESDTTWRRIDIPVQIVVTDVNDNGPQFSGTPYRISVNELTPVGSIVFKNIHATDGDSSDNMVIYSVVRGPYSDYVRFDDSLSGILVLNTRLDYEQIQVFNVTIMARDQGTPPLRASTFLEITVEDGDDQNPDFRQSAYMATLARDPPLGYQLKVQPETIHAVDKDIAINASVEYRITDGAACFDINKTSGLVFVNDTVPPSGLFVLTVRASQENDPGKYALTTLRITTERPNHNAPRFLHREYAQKVPENIPSGTTVMSLRALDSDVAANLVYSLLFPNTAPQFSLTTGGDLVLAGQMDFERTSQHVMFVGVTDGEFTDQARIVIDVLNVNDHDPEFGKTNYSFDGLRLTGTSPGTISVSDRDGDNTTLTLLNHCDVFELQSRAFGASDLVITDESFINQTEYRLNVLAVDTGQPPRKAFVTVIVRFPPVALAAMTFESSEFFVLALVLGTLAGVLLLVVLCLVCYVGKKKPWTRKSPASSLRSSALDDDTRGLTYKQRHHYYHDMPSSSTSSSSSNASDTSSTDLHPSEQLERILNGIENAQPPPPSRMISAWDATASPIMTSSAAAGGGVMLTPVTPDLGLNPKGIILSTGHNTRSIGPLRKQQKRLKWEDEEQPRKTASSDFECRWQSAETLSPMQTDTERPEVTVYF